MSKKKATMTLKDFHGGSIPSDLPLPSAPGVTARPSDRQGSWANPIGRLDHRLRPGSAGAVRNYDDKAPHLSPNVHIGRNFDEDERKPLDGVSGPRRTFSDESIRAVPTRAELKSDYSSTGILPSRPISSPASNFSGSSASSYAGRVVEATHTGGNSQNFDGNNSYSSRFPEAANAGVSSPSMGGNSGKAAPGVYPNAWAIRREAVSTIDPLPATGSSPNAASKLAHASALEKVSSGRWQSKQTIHHQADVEVIRHTAIESEFHTQGDGFYDKSSYHAMDVAGRVEYHDEMLVRHAERSLTVDDRIQGGVRELPNFEESRFPMFHKSIKSNPPSYVGARSDFGESELPSEQSERPKLKLLPRSKAMEGEPPVDYKQAYQANTFSEGDPPVDYKQVHQVNIFSEDEPHIDYKQGHRLPRSSDNVENFAESFGKANPLKSGLTGHDSGNLAVERPKLNLKPRSQPLEKSEGNIIRGRNTVFGEARPRELVLKERGIDDVAVNNHDVVQSPNRVKQDVPRTETLPTKVTHAGYNEKTESIPLDNRVRKNNDRRDDRFGVERTGMQRRDNRVDFERTDMQRRDNRVDVDRTDMQRRDNRVDVERTDMQRRDNRVDVERTDIQRKGNRADVDRTDTQRKNWRSDNWRNRETEKHHHSHQQQERPPSPETWRKPTEQPKPESPDAPGLRYGKAASAVELAQAFSRSVSDPKAADRLPGQRGIPGRGQIPFSRLTDPTSRPQINGY